MTSRLFIILGLFAGTGLSSPAWAEGDDSSVDLKIYGDTGFSVRNHAPINNSFDASRLELFPTASVDRLSFLAEAMFEAGPETNEFGVDVERMQVAYLFADWFRLKAGRMHTAYGYYNDAYHHGKIFELATERPFLAQFEDDDGLLQAHIVGVAADGKVPLGSALDLHYDLEAGNGRGRILNEVSVAEARKNNKMMNVRLRLLPHFLDGLILGGNFLYDEVPATPQPAIPVVPPIGVAHTLREMVVGAHVAYMEHSFHVLLEGSYILHRDLVTAVTYTDRGGFAELGYTVGVVTPYVRYEHIDFDQRGDPFYAQVATFAGVNAVNDFRVGVKWAATENIAFKLEGRTFMTSMFVATPSQSQQSATLQAAFGF